MTIEETTISESPAGQARGFSLIELMIALVLSIFLIGGISLLFLSGRVAANDTERLSRAQESLRFAATFMIQDIRMAGYRSGPDYATLVPDNGSLGLRVRYGSPRDCTGQPTSPVGDESEDLFSDDGGIVDNTYVLRNGQLVCVGKRGEGGSVEFETGSAVLLDGVRSLAFELLPNDSSPLAVRVRLEMEDLPEYAFLIALRNPILASIAAD